jgi:hypothetical protein
MTYTWLTDLDQALRAGGVPYTEVPASSVDPTGAASWRTRGRPGSTGNFDPWGVLCHHTASPAGTSDRAELNVIVAGNSQAPGPIAQLFIGRSGATVYLVAAGRANHGGKGKRPGIDAVCADMNAALIGIEAANNGTGERWSDALTDIYGATVAALCSWYGWAVEHDVYLHATTGPPSGGCNSKIDPAGPWQGEPSCAGTWNLDTWRRFVTTCAGQGPAPSPPPQGGDNVLTIFQCSDAWAGFLGFAWNGIGQTVEWVNGDTAAWYRSLGCPEQTITVEQCSGFTLIGSLPEGDGAHDWTGREFRRVLV